MRRLLRASTADLVPEDCGERPLVTPEECGDSSAGVSDGVSISSLPPNSSSSSCGLNQPLGFVIGYMLKDSPQRRADRCRQLLAATRFLGVRLQIGVFPDS